MGVIFGDRVEGHEIVEYLGPIVHIWQSSSSIPISSQFMGLENEDEWAINTKIVHVNYDSFIVYADKVKVKRYEEPPY